MRTTLLFIIALLCCFSSGILSQNGTVSMETIQSTILFNRTIRYNVYLPPTYGRDTTAKYPVLYLLHGKGGNNTDYTNTDNNAGLVEKMQTAILNGGYEMIVIVPNGLDAFYCNNYDSRKLRYEDFMVQELIPQVESKYRIIGSKSTRAIAGLSMGGYGATYHAFKYPDMYSSCYSMSGALIPGVTAPSIETLLDSLTAEQLKSLPPLTMEVGLQDPLVYNMNVDFHNFLLTKNVAHNYIERDGTHEWAFWIACLPKVIQFANDHFDSASIVRSDTVIRPDTIKVSSIKSIDEDNIKVYPNPTTEWMNVKVNNETIVTICDMTGRIVNKKYTVNSTGSFYVGNLTNGLYLVNIEQKNKRRFFKIIKN